MKHTQEFTLNELNGLEANITIFRACPAISFASANDINANLSPIKEAINACQDKISV